jgi:hypothetical protein
MFAQSGVPLIGSFSQSVTAGRKARHVATLEQSSNAHDDFYGVSK